MSIFDLDKFEQENPVFDPFVERVNDRETSEHLSCWGCNGLFDRVSGRRVGDADPNGEEVSALLELCPNCVNSINEKHSYYEY